MERSTKHYSITLTDPSGKARTSSLKEGEKITVGTGMVADFDARDITIPAQALTLELEKHSQGLKVHVQTSTESPAFEIYGISAREALIPVGTKIKIGECEIQVHEMKQDSASPSMPHGYPAWLTDTESGVKTLWNAKKSAETPLSIYLAGETGSGKEVLAHLIHAWSTRSSGEFIPLHCGALSESLAESELFGHTKGAFTGAIKDRPGALLQAHNGTLFLDEVGDLSLDLQVKLLRFLENGEIRPVGSDRTVHADVRVICATHLPLLELVEKGKFRRDLYYRLASVTIEIPPLRSRPADIELLAHRYSSALGKSLSPDALLRLKTYHWPGNVRELKHAIERAVGMAGSLTPVLEKEAFEFLANNSVAEFHRDENGPILSLNEIQRQMILKALKRCSGNRADAAKLLGIARSTLFEMLKRHKIRGPRSKTITPDETNYVICA